MRAGARVGRPRHWLAAVILITALLTPGCFGQNEIEDVGFVLAIGVDLAEDGQLDVTLQMAVPAITKDENVSVLVVTQRAPSIASAMEKLAVTTNKVPSLSQARLIIFGQTIAQRGIGPSVDYLTRNHDARLLIWVMVTPGKARDILSAKARTETISANMISGLQHEARQTALAPQTSLLELLDHIGTFARDPLVAAVTLAAPPEGGGASSGESGGEGGGANQGVNPVRLEGAAVFRGDRLVGWLSASEARGFLWLEGEADRTLLDYRDDQTGATGTVRVFINTAKWSVVPDTVNPGRTRFSVAIRADGQINELTGGVASEQSGNFSNLEKTLAALIKAEAVAALTKQQSEFRADFIGLGEYLRSRVSSRTWRGLDKLWADQYMPQTTVDVSVSFRLRRPGSTRAELVPAGRQ